MNPHDAEDRPIRVGRGQISPQPEGFYQPELVRHEPNGSLTVAFAGEDGRSRVYSFADRPCPGLHEALADAFEARVGSVGQLRTLSTANGHWEDVGRFLAYLGALGRPPKTPADLRWAHVASFRAYRLLTVKKHCVDREVGRIRLLLLAIPSRFELDPVLLDRLADPIPKDRRPAAGEQPQIGYSDRELALIMAAARSDVVAIRTRLQASENLLEAFHNDPQALEPERQELAAKLAQMAATGRPQPADWPQFKVATGGTAARSAAAAQLFLVASDLTPLLILGVALSARNVETLKELAAEHRVVGERAVAVGLVKRRRGKALTRESAHWETGGSLSRQLHTPGGFYLLLHELTQRSRMFSGAMRVWSIWTPEYLGKPELREQKARTAGHIDPFARTIAVSLRLGDWARRHGLTDDSGRPLEMTLNRLKTTAEVRLTKLAGGHLAAASRTNTFDVSFLHYLRDDPRIKEWADEILTEALQDAEASVHSFHLRIIDDAARKAFAADPAGTAEALGTSPEKIKSAAEGELDTAIASCLDHEHHPQTGRRCAVSFRACLRCENALVLERHLPVLLAYLDQMQAELDRLGVERWCGEYGIDWLIVTRLVLPKFTEAQQKRAAAERPRDLLPLIMLDGPKEFE